MRTAPSRVIRGLAKLLGVVIVGLAVGGGLGLAAGALTNSGGSDEQEVAAPAPDVSATATPVASFSTDAHYQRTAIKVSAARTPRSTCSSSATSACRRSVPA